jgi:hypothetical protein
MTRRSSGISRFVTSIQVRSHSNMALAFYIRAVLLMVAPIHTVAHLHPRQHTLNDTATPTTNSSQTASITTPPPCCWIVIGDFAVGYNSWYSSTAEKVVGTHKNPQSLRAES